MLSPSVTYFWWWRSNARPDGDCFVNTKSSDASEIFFCATASLVICVMFRKFGRLVRSRHSISMAYLLPQSKCVEAFLCKIVQVLIWNLHNKFCSNKTGTLTQNISTVESEFSESEQNKNFVVCTAAFRVHPE